MRKGQARKEVTVALVTGPAYDSLYERLQGFTEATGVRVSLGFGGDHPALNRHLASLDEVPYDLVSTHTKYAPSQLDFLASLDGLVGADELGDFVPLILELTSVGGSLYGVPRNIDVRLLHYRADLVRRPPATWDALLEEARAQHAPPRRYGFVFPGRESGLFGTFYELAEMAGARLAMLEEVIAKHILVPPKFARYPLVEDVLWHAVQRTIVGELDIDKALAHMTCQIGRIVRGEND